MNLFSRVVILTLLLLTGATACSRSSATEVVVYTSEDQVFSEPVLKNFERTTGIRVRAVYDTEETKSTGVALRILAERNRPQADVFWANEPLRTVMLKREGVLAPYESPSARGIRDRYRDRDGYWTGFAARARVILYNTAVVRPNEAPSSVRDLVDPRWKGRAGLANPLFGTTTTQVAALVRVWGDEVTQKFLDNVKANGVKLATSNGEAKDLIVSGELAWAFVDSDDANEALDQKKPVAVVYPDQDGIGTLVMPNAVALVKNAPHPEPGRKLIDYLLSADVEGRLAKSAAQMPLHAGVATPAHLKPVSDVKDMPVSYPELGQTIDRILPFLKRWSGAG